MAIIVPQIFADVVNKRLGVKLRAGRLATDYTNMVEDITTCGDTVHFPMIKRIMDAFTSVMKTNATYGNGIVQDGIIGYWNGTIPVYVSDNGTYDDTNHKALLAIVKNDALGVVWQQEPTIEEEREAKLLADDIVASEMYATKLIDAAGVSVLKVSVNP